MWILNNKTDRCVDIRTGKECFVSEYKGYFNVVVPCTYQDKASFMTIFSSKNMVEAQAKLSDLCKQLNKAHYKF